MEAHRDPFMEGCRERAQSEEYCSCAFDQFREVFADVDVSEPLPENDPRFTKLKDRTVAACGSKLGEDQVKSNFVTACVGGDGRKDAYCACAWTSLRKKLEPADFLGGAQTPAFIDAKKSMVAECKGKFPEEVARFEFMGACTKQQATREATCTCLWKKLRVKFTTEEIAAGTADLNAVPDLDECKE
jgi:hypothetical protein